MKKTLIVLSSAVVVLGCRTMTRSSSETQSAPSAASASSAEDEADENKILLEMSGRSAKSLYNVLSIGETSTMGGGSKRVDGKIDIHCVAPFASQLPPGAQGMPSVQSAKCDILKLPAQVMINGIVGPSSLAKLQGKIANQFYAALEVPELESFPPQKTFTGNASFGCSYSLVSGGVKRYKCSLIARGDDPAPSSALVSLKGESARTVFQRMTVAASANNTKKSFVGKAVIGCEHTPGGGNIPPGAQGMVAPAQTTCSVIDGATAIPPGAQGIVAPRVIVEVTGAAAYDFYQSFAAIPLLQDPTVTPPNPTKIKRYEGKVDFTCTYDPHMHVSVEQAYKCEIVKKQ